MQEAEGAVPSEPFLESYSVRGEQGWYLVLNNRFEAEGSPELISAMYREATACF